MPDGEVAGSSDGENDGGDGGPENSGGDGPPPPSGSGTERTTHNVSGYYDISVSGPVRPGRAATITVERDGSPVEGVAVSRDGAFVGRTDQFGQTSGAVPYAASMTLVAEHASNRTVDGGDTDETDGDVGQYHPALAAASPAPGVVTGNESVPTAVEIVPFRDTRPGRTVTFLAHVEGVPVAEGRVFRNGERAGQTDENGRFSAAIPWNESTTVAVERGEATGEREIRPRPLDVTVRNPGLGFLAAGQSVTVSVSQGGRPVDGATVLVDGDERVRTDEDGTAAVALPTNDEATVSVSRGEMRATTNLGGLYSPYVTASLGAGGVLLGLIVVAVFRGRLGAAATAGYGYATWFGRCVAVALVRAADAIVALASRLRELLGAVLASLRRRDPLAALALVRDTILDALGRLVDRVRSLSIPRDGSGSASPSASADEDRPAPASGRQTSAENGVIRRAFERLLDRIPGRARTLTPTEVGQRAVDHGLPADAVWPIADTFRAVTYGGRDPELLVDDVRAAVERLHASEETTTEEDEQ